MRTWRSPWRCSYARCLHASRQYSRGRPGRRAVMNGTAHHEHGRPGATRSSTPGAAHPVPAGAPGTPCGSLVLLSTPSRRGAGVGSSSMADGYSTGVTTLPRCTVPCAAAPGPGRPSGPPRHHRPSRPPAPPALPTSRPTPDPSTHRPPRRHRHLAEPSVTKPQSPTPLPAPGESSVTNGPVRHRRFEKGLGAWSFVTDGSPGGPRSTVGTSFVTDDSPVGQAEHGRHEFRH